MGQASPEIQHSEDEAGHHYHDTQDSPAKHQGHAQNLHQSSLINNLTFLKENANI